MPVVISAKTSTDAGNRVGFGTDGNISAPSPDGGDSNPLYVIDNSWATSGGSYGYQVGATNGSGSFAPAIAQATLQPFMLLRGGRITQASLGCSTAGNGNGYLSVYASNPTTGWPNNKVTDLGQVYSASSTGVNTATISNTTVFAARTMYWLAYWSTGSTAPTLYCKAGMMMFPPRLPYMPASIATTLIPIALYDTSITWSSVTTAPATVTPALNASSSNVYYPPLVYFNITNV